MRYSCIEYSRHGHFAQKNGRSYVHFVYDNALDECVTMRQNISCTLTPAHCRKRVSRRQGVGSNRVHIILGQKQPTVKRVTLFTV